MKRREFLKTGALLGTGVFLEGSPAAFAASARAEQRPNILFVMTDQQTARAMSCAGNHDLKTPAMDFLAEHGHRFTRAYCPQPLCGPSRSSMFTGRMPHEINATRNLPQTPGHWQNLPMMGALMKTAGYDTGYVGKWHLPVPVQEKELHGFDFIIEKTHGNWADPSIPFDCQDFLSRKRSQPFLLVASFTNPHDICEWARGEALRQDFIGASPAPGQCPELPHNFEIPHDEPEILREIQALSWKQYPTRDWDENRWRQYRWAYNRLTEKVDYYIGMLIETLKKAGQLENTVIIFTSDHGDGCGSHRWNQKQILYEEVINVPFIVSLPGRLHARTDDRLVSAGLDILPTLLDFAGTPQPAGMNGRSLRPLLEGQTTTWRDYLVVETEFAEGSKLYGVSGRSVISRSHKYTIYSQGKKREQFFDLAADPGETNDLLNQSPKNKQLKQLKKQLATWVETTRDPFVQFLNP